MQQKIKNFTILKELGRGANGYVYLAIKDEDQKQYAFKLLEDEISKQESEIMDQLSKYELNNIVRTYEKFSYKTEFMDYSCIVMDFCNNGDLAYFLTQQRKNLKIENIKDILFQIAFGVWELQQFNIIHRDLKPQNILIHIETDQCLAKICDLGLSKIFRKNVMHTINIGTPYYMAPELIQQTDLQNYDTSVDIWAFGVMIFDFFSEKQLFYGQKIKNIFEQILNPKIQEKLNSEIYDEKIKLICEKCLNIIPQQRPKIQQILEDLDSIKFNDRKQKFLNQIKYLEEVSNSSIIRQMETNHEQSLKNDDELQQKKHINEFTQKQYDQKESQLNQIIHAHEHQEAQNKIDQPLVNNLNENHNEEMPNLSNSSSKLQNHPQNHKVIQIEVQKKVKILAKIKDNLFAKKLIQMQNQQRSYNEILSELKNKADQLILCSQDDF